MCQVIIQMIPGLSGITGSSIPETVSGMIVSAVDLFCGIGGLTYGLSKSGVAVRAGFDNDISCRFAYETNNLQSEFYNADVRDVCSADIAPHYEGADVTVMVGCAPCQPFSSHTRKTRIPDDEDCSLVDDFARLVKECEPDIVSMENVPGLAKHQAFYRLLRTLRHLEYEYQCEVISCIKYGVPQDKAEVSTACFSTGHDLASSPDGKSPDCSGFHQRAAGHRRWEAVSERPDTHDATSILSKIVIEFDSRCPVERGKIGMMPISIDAIAAHTIQPHTEE